MNVYELTTSRYFSGNTGRIYNYRSFKVGAVSLDKAVSKIKRQLDNKERVEEIKLLVCEMDE